MHEKRVKGSIFGQRHHKRCERISEGEHAPLKKLPDTLKQTKTTPRWEQAKISTLVSSAHIAVSNTLLLVCFCDKMSLQRDYRAHWYFSVCVLSGKTGPFNNLFKKIMWTSSTFFCPKVTLNHGRPVPAVLLANKSDQLVSQQPKLDVFCRENGFVGWFETSAKVWERRPTWLLMQSLQQAVDFLRQIVEYTKDFCANC